MRTLKMVGATLGALALSAAVLAGPANATPGDRVWKANGESRITGPHSVKLTGSNTSVEAGKLGMTISANTPITFEVELSDGATCAGGAPRVFVVVDSTNTNSWDQLQPLGKQCGEEGKITFVVAAGGAIGQAGAVFDNGGTGSVVVKNLKIGDKIVDFQAVEAGPTPNPTPPTQKPSVKPQPRGCEAYLYTGTQQNLCADFPSPTGKVDCSDVRYMVTLINVANDPWGLDGNRGKPGIGCESNPMKSNAGPSAPGSSVAGGGLPVTGINGSALAGIGLGAALLGAGTVFLARRRRSRFTA